VELAFFLVFSLKLCTSEIKGLFFLSFCHHLKVFIKHFICFCVCLKIVVLHGKKITFFYCAQNAVVLNQSSFYFKLHLVTWAFNK